MPYLEETFFKFQYNGIAYLVFMHGRATVIRAKVHSLVYQTVARLASASPK
jgi:hypothetical protein